MYTRATGLALLCAASALVAGCGGSSTPDVTGAAASDSATLFKASNLGKVLKQVKSEMAGTPAMVVKIEPRDVKVVGQSRTITVDSSGKAVVVKTPSIPGPPTFNLTVVSPAKVESIVRAVEARAAIKQSGIAYVAVAVDPINNRPFYGVYPTTGLGHYQADINGGHLKAYGGSAGAATSGGAANGQGVASCVTKAGGDPAKIAACSGG